MTVQEFGLRVLACITQRKATGWHSAMFEPMIMMLSACFMSMEKVVAPPRPNEVPRPGTVELCHIRAWFSIMTTHGFGARVFACITQRNATGWHSAMFEPMIRMLSAFFMSIANVVAPPRPYEVPRPGTVELCQIRAWFSMKTSPSARINLHWT